MLLRGVSGCCSPAGQQHQQQQQQLWQQHVVPQSAGNQRQQRVLVVAAAAGTEPSSKKHIPNKAHPQPSGSRNARLYELFEDDGWGVEAMPAAPAAQQPATPAPPQRKVQQQQQQQKRTAGKGGKASPYVAMRSEEGKLGLTLLQRVLQVEEAQQQQQQQQPAPGDGSSSSKKPSMDQIRAQLAAASRSSKASKAKLPGFPKAGAAAAAAGAGSQLLPGVAGSSSELYGGDDDYDEDEDEATPAFQITFDKEGRAAMESFVDSDAGATSPSAADAGAAEADLDDFGMSGWGQFEVEDAEPELEPEPEQQPRKQAKRGKGAAAAKGSAEDDESDMELALLRDLSNEDDWGLESLTTPGLSNLQMGRGRRSLIDELTEAEEAARLGADTGFTGSVQWGGTAGTTGIDMEEQEAILTRYFKADQVKKLMQEQQEVDASYSVLRRRAVGLDVSDHKMQEKLRIVSGSAAGRKLVSFKSPQTRPMMEKVRQAIFNMLQSRSGTLTCLPRTARWLDLFAGTGSVGLEALSRGVHEAHFVEMDQVVVSKILERNIKSCGFKGKAWTHTSKAEDFLRRSAAVPRFAGGAFDFISVCPPYLLVSYPELFELLDASPLVHPGTLLFVEYPKQLSHQIVDTIGPLQRVRDRRYGRTWVALYAAGGDDSAGAAEDDAAADEEDPFLAMGM